MRISDWSSDVCSSDLLYAFSSENWRRPEAEINDLMGLLRFYIGSELNALHGEGIRLVILGDHKAFKPDVARMVDEAVARTADNRRMTLAIAPNYGGRKNGRASCWESGVPYVSDTGVAV